MCFYGNCVFLFPLYTIVKNVTGLYLSFTIWFERRLSWGSSPIGRSPHWLLSLYDRSCIILCNSCSPGGKYCQNWERERNHWKLDVRLVSGGFLGEDSAFPAVIHGTLGIPADASGLQKCVCFYLGVKCLLLSKWMQGYPDIYQLSCLNLLHLWFLK